TGQRTNWSTDAKEFRERPRGQKLTFTCPPAGAAGTVYGTDIYTDDSSICTAAAHAGAITIADGGKVTIILRGGQAVYAGSTQNGVTSSDWNGPWGWSFEIENGKPRSQSNIPVIPWSQVANDYSGHAGKRFTFKCPPKGEAASVWGTGVYTDDSSICTAGVHAGKITLEEGGIVTIMITEGASAFHGSSRNGIDSSDWSEWPRGFRVV
ncbi:LCCL domain-containing protein, partial [Streptomyces wedmorensis]